MLSPYLGSLITTHLFLIHRRGIATTIGWIAHLHQSCFTATAKFPCPWQGIPLYLISPVKITRIFNLQIMLRSFAWISDLATDMHLPPTNQYTTWVLGVGKRHKDWFHCLARSCTLPHTSGSLRSCKMWHMLFLIHEALLHMRLLLQQWSQP